MLGMRLHARLRRVAYHELESRVEPQPARLSCCSLFGLARRLHCGRTFNPPLIQLNRSLANTKNNFLDILGFGYRLRLAKPWHTTTGQLLTLFRGTECHLVN